VPQAIGIYIADSLLVAGVVNSAATYAFVQTAVTVAAYAASAYMLNQAAEAMAPDAPNTASGYNVNYSGTAEPRRLIYGEVVIGGMHTIPPICTGTDGKLMHLVQTLAGHEVNSITDVLFDDDIITNGQISAVTGTDDDGEVTAGKFKKRAWLRRYTGTASQTADYILTQADPLVFTADFRGRGIAYIAIRLKSGDVFKGGVPTVLCKVQGKKILDTRTATTAYSTNSALIVRDFLVNEVGFDADQIDESLCNAAANICEQSVAIPPSGTEARYTTNVVLYSDAPWEDNLKTLVDAMHGRVVYRDGQWRIYAGAWDTPSVTLDQGSWISPVEVQASLARDERWNYVKAWYTDKDRRYTRQQAYERSNATYETADASQRIPISLELPAVTGEYQAQRIAELQLRKSRNQLRIAGRLRPEYIKLSTFDTVYITDAEFGWTLKTFRIMTMDAQPDGSVDIAAVEEGSAGYADLTAGEYFTPSTWNTIDPSGSRSGAYILDPQFYDEQFWTDYSFSFGASNSYTLEHVIGGGANPIYGSWIATIKEGTIGGGGIDNIRLASVRTPAFPLLPGQWVHKTIRWRVNSRLYYDLAGASANSVFPLEFFTEVDNAVAGLKESTTLDAGRISAAFLDSAVLGQWYVTNLSVQPYVSAGTETFLNAREYINIMVGGAMATCVKSGQLEFDAYDAQVLTTGGGAGGTVAWATNANVRSGTGGNVAINPANVLAEIARLFGANALGAGNATKACNLGDVSGTVHINCHSSNVFRLRLVGNVTLATSNQLDGQFVNLRIKQNGAGGKTITYPAYIDVMSGQVIASGGDKKSLIGMQWDAVDSSWDAMIRKGW